MSATKAEFRDLTRREIEIDPDGDIWEDDQMDDYIDEGHEQVQLDLSLRSADNEDGSHSFSTVVGTLEYDLPTTLGRMGKDGLVKYDGSRMTETSKKRLLQTSDLSTQGDPSQFYIEGDKIGFDLTPGNEKTVEMFFLQLIAPPEESTGSDLSADFDLSIAKYVKYLCFKNSKNFRSSAEDAFSEYQTEINRKRLKHLTRKPIDMTFGYQRR